MFFIRFFLFPKQIPCGWGIQLTSPAHTVLPSVMMSPLRVVCVSVSPAIVAVCWL